MPLGRKRCHERDVQRPGQSAANSRLPQRSERGDPERWVVSETSHINIEDPHACKLWGRTGCISLSAVDAALRPLATALAQVMQLTKSARTDATISGDVATAVAAVAKLQQVAKRIDQAKDQAGSGLTKPDRKAAATLVGWLRQHLAAAVCWLRPPGPQICCRTLSAEAVIHTAVALDGAYYALLEHFLTCSWAAPAVHPPHVYFPALAAAHAGNATAVEELLREHAPTLGMDLLLETWDLELSDSASSVPDSLHAPVEQPASCKGSSAGGEVAIASNPSGHIVLGDGSKALRLDARQACANPLLAVMWARFQEAARFFSQAGLQHGIGMADPDDEDSSSNRWATAPCSASMTAWRSASREVHVYAFAAPNRAAIKVLLRRAPLVEIGAGTGYWAWVLRQSGVDVLAFDVAPPGQPATASNTYHGRIPCFTEVTAGGVKQCGRYRQHTLLLCYPPPARSMAVDCLTQFRGNCVCVIGEWDGDTGNASFTAALQTGWRLSERVPLPNWTDTSHELTVWERLSSGMMYAEDSASGRVRVGGVAASGTDCGQAQQAAQGPDGRTISIPIAACDACGSTGRLRRCCHCRSIVYCSSNCRKAHGVAHAEVHAMRFLHLTKRLSFRSNDDFESLDL